MSSIKQRILTAFHNNPRLAQYFRFRILCGPNSSAFDCEFVSTELYNYFNQLSSSAMSYEHFCHAYLRPLDDVYIELDRYGVLIYRVGI